MIDPDSPLLDRLAALCAVTWLVLGAGLAVGPDPWRTSPSYTEVRRLLPLRDWGIVFLLIGAAQLVAVAVAGRQPARRLAFAVGLAAALVWLVAFALTAVDAELAGVPAVWLLLAGVQGLLVERRPPWARSRR